MKGIPVELYWADVIDNNDPNQYGRVKIRIPQFHTDLSEDLLPWAYQFVQSTGGSSTYGKSFIPENGSKIWVGFFDPEDLKKPYYLSDIQLSEFNPHLLFNDNIKSNISSASSYPNTKFTYYKNGICAGVDSSTNNPEIFISHPKWNILINKDGKLHIKDINNNEITIDNNGIDIKDKNSNEIKMVSGAIELNGNSKKFVTYDALNTSLQQMVTLANLTFLTAADGGVKSGGLTLDISSSSTTSIKTGG